MSWTALLLPVVALAANDATIAPDRMLMINGERTFVLGLYENPADDAVLDEAVRAGFNLIQSTPDVAQLDRLHNRGAYAWINAGYNLDLSTSAESRKAALDEMVKTCAEHPSMLVWEVPDEALWNVWYGTTLWRAETEVRQQREAIAALTDQAVAERLRAMRAKASEHWRRAEFTEAEKLADAIWRELGQEPPRPAETMATAATRASTMADGLLAGYTYLKGLDTRHVVWMNHAPRNSIAQRAAFNKAADITGCDIYPVPMYRTEHSDLSDRSLASVGSYTRLMQAAAPEKPVWMVLQGFAWKELGERKNDPEADKMRHPSYEETRFMAYDAIVNGARGVLYWGTAYTDRTAPFWPDLLKVVRELADLSPVLASPEANLSITVTYEETWGSMDRAVRVLPKQTKDGVYLIVVNEWQDPLVYTLDGLSVLNGTTFTDETTAASATVKNGKLTLNIQPFGVHVLKSK